MSLSVGAGMAIAGGIAAASSAGSAIAQGKLNRKNRKWQEKMYNQRLQDQRADWQMQNEYNEEMYNKYNSPIAQVQQQQAAGLNPDLNGIDSQSLPAAGSLPAAPDAGSAPYQMPAMDFVGTFAQMASMFQQIEAASLDNDLKREQIRNSVLPDVLDLAARNYDPDSKYTSDDLQIPVLSPKYLRNYFLSRGMSKASSRIAANMFSKLDPKDVIKSYFDKDSGMNKSRTDNAAITGDALFSDNNDTLKSNFKTFSYAIAEFNKLLREAQTSKAKYDKAFYDNSNGGDDATALYNDKQFSAGLKEQAYNKGSNYNKYYKQFDDFAKNLDEQGSFGSFLSFIARILWNKYLEK
jgi:hypothetical protein